MKVAVVLDGTAGHRATVAQASALSGFLRQGLGTAADGQAVPPDGPAALPGLEAVTLAFYGDDEDGRARVVELAPTRGVRLHRVSLHPLEGSAGILTALAQRRGTDLFLFAGGRRGCELAVRLAHRAGGSVATGVLDARLREAALECRRNVYSNHLIGRFVLGPRPWCVSVDAVWADAEPAGGLEHAVLSDGRVARPEPDASPGAPAPDARGAAAAGGPGGAELAAGPPPIEDLEVLAAPPTGDLEAAAFLVVAGYGAGRRRDVERIAAATRTMEAAFGVTRPVAMNAWAPMDRLVGVSGTRTAPAVCVVAGAHGAPAFVWGIARAGFIAAVDLDEHAPIVRAADVVVLDDAVAVVEALAEIVADERSRDSGGPQA